VSRQGHNGVRVTSPAPRDAWEAAVAADPNVLVSHTPAWIDLVCSFGGYADASRLYELGSGRRLVLPMVRRRHLPRPLAPEDSLPLCWDAGGIVASGGITARDLQAVFEDLTARPVVRTALRPGPLDAREWDAARPPGTMVPRLAHVLDLEGGFGEIWERRFAGTARTAVRKAERSGLTVERDTTGRLMPAVYELFERSLDRRAQQQHEPRALARWRGHRRDSRRRFISIALALGEACRTWVAWRDGQPAAAIIVMQGANANYTRGMMDKELAGPTRADYLLHQLAIEDACNAGCRYYNMGESGTSQALAQFKTRFGARPRPYAEFHIERVPITALDSRARGLVKRVIGFRD
jgi:Acetyltransferase (GNAT) domain